MPKPGLHPATQLARLVKRDGSSVLLPYVFRAERPIVLRTDHTMLPSWTGNTDALSQEDEQYLRFMQRSGDRLAFAKAGGAPQEGAEAGEPPVRHKAAAPKKKGKR